MSNASRIAQELDRVRREIDVEMNQRMPRLDANKMGQHGSMLLLQLADLKIASIKELAESMGRDHSQTARVVKQLVAKGAIEREPNPLDKRESKLRVTPKGKKHLKQMRKVLSEIVESLLQELSKSQVTLLLELLRKI